MERDPLAKSDQYETDEEIREQPAGTEPNIRRDKEPEGGDRRAKGPHDKHGHGDVNDDEDKWPNSSSR